MAEYNRIGFLSKSERKCGFDAEPTPGPYAGLFTSKNDLPNFAPFQSTSKRNISLNDNTFQAPAPGQYDIIEVKNNNPAGALFKSRTNRFGDKSKTKQSNVGPGTYDLKSCISTSTHNVGLQRSASRPTTKTDYLNIVPKSPQVPSIPTKFQSFGYEEDEDGLLIRQAPLKPGYLGTRDDSAGPGDYDPDIKGGKFNKSHGVTFSKGHDKFATTTSINTPGPGYYNQPSSFEDFDSNGDVVYGNGEYIMRSNVVKSRQTSAFESKTTRSELISSERLLGPGPGTYSIPSAISVKKKDPALQCFDTLEMRFRETKPRSQQILTAPGSYTPMTSDFDNNRLKILKHKRMASRSGWAQNISFQATEERFFSPSKGSLAPPAGTYTPKNALSDCIPHENTRAGPFGSTVKRFFVPKGSALLDDAKRESSQESFELYQNSKSSGHSSGHHVETVPLHKKFERPSRVFAGSDSRFKKLLDRDPGPPPGHYNVRPKWTQVAGVVAMTEHHTQSLPKERIVPPGPGEYEIPPTIGAMKLKKSQMNPLAKSSDRFVEKRVDINPGPGYYDPVKPGAFGSIVVPTHNIVLAEACFM